MDLYDVHTHSAPLPSDDDVEPEGKKINYILDVYPLGFEDAKDMASLNCFFSCGVHPWYSEDAQPQLDFLKEIASNPRIIAIGEAGYDKLKGADIETQRTVFEQQIQLSEQLHKPLIIHCVKAWDDLYASYRKYNPRQPWILHGYRGGEELTRQLLDMDVYFSLGAKYNKDSLRVIPTDRLLCETDTQNCTIEEIYADISAALNIQMLDFSEKIEQNVRRIFPQFAV
ncbi:TatD DNase family protein [Dysgonomonas sp. PH5-45]|uniref:TatD family hydrolase n=1 Tax=unclassified Dysgonomonas TaxID=2630389 RepID=UPI0024737591|nr:MULTISPECIES: TatD family hydrolase [unclassified Dysgonomonas]MDH6354962.1 TatD DNase family protein [Dysgonomonas sp. PH5-45]MDH6387914.1 TatD DNase family protein [Dysgonomonas sp. PH5-37]